MLPPAMRRAPVIVVLAFAAIIAGCASTGGTAAGGSATRATRKDPSVMDSTELRSGNFGTVYDAVSGLHADWLLPRGGPTGQRSPELGIWIEGQLRTRPVDFLKTLRPVDIKSIRRLSPTESLHTYSWPWGGLVITPR